MWSFLEQAGVGGRNTEVGPTPISFVMLCSDVPLRERSALKMPPQ